MSDYLDNLLARNDNLPEMVQPRPISLFEPLPGATWSPSDHLLAPEVGEGEPISGDWTLDALETAQPAGGHLPAIPLMTDPAVKRGHPGILPARADQRAVLSAPKQPPVPAAIQSDDTRAEPPHIQVKASPAQHKSSPVSATRVQPESVRMTEPGPLRSSVSQLVPAPAARVAAGGQAPQAVAERVAQPALERIIEHTVIERIIRQAASPPTPAADASSQATTPRSLTERKSRVAVKAVIPQPGPVPPLPIVARPQVRLQPEPGLPPATESAAKPETTIQVTIGRIEVRATPAASPPRKQTPTAPMLSLEDYLRQRNGGA